MIPGLTKNNLAHEILLSNLSQPAQQLFIQFSRLECGYPIVHLLQTRSTTFLTCQDIAYHLARPVALVINDLEILEQLKIVQQTKAGEISFYRLNATLAQSGLFEELWHWQTHWDNQIRQMQSLIWGERSARWETCSPP